MNLEIVQDRTRPPAERVAAAEGAAAWAARHTRECCINHLARPIPDAPPVRAAAVSALAEMARVPLTPYLKERLRADLAQLDRELTVLPLANLAWTYGAQPRVITAARRALATSADPWIRRIGLQQLCSLGHTEAAIEVFESDAPKAPREAAAEFLGYYWAGDEAARAALDRAFDDAQPAVAEAARKARRRLGLDKSPRPRSALRRIDARVWTVRHLGSKIQRGQLSRSPTVRTVSTSASPEPGGYGGHLKARP